MKQTLSHTELLVLHSQPFTASIFFYTLRLSLGNAASELI